MKFYQQHRFASAATLGQIATRFIPAAAMFMVLLVILFNHSPLSAQTQQAPAKADWTEFGFTNVPDGVSTDLIPLFKSLNEARGTWTMKGQLKQEASNVPFEAELHVAGTPQAGMFPFWNLACRWKSGDSEQAIQYNLIASPSKGGLELMLFRFGPIVPSNPEMKNKKVRPTGFSGTWDLSNRRITWTESDMSLRSKGADAEPEPLTTKQSFEMTITKDGKISLQNSKGIANGMVANGTAILRTKHAPPAPTLLTGKHQFKTAAEILDRRILPSVPPLATDVELVCERAGHLARYRIEGHDFKKFLDELWQARKDSSAHQRHEMHGEGEPADLKQMASRFKAADWEPLEQATIYYSPSKRNGAITTYYVDSQHGIVYHDTGYW